MSDIVLLADPEVAGIDVAECGEPLVDLRELGVFHIDRRLADPRGAFTHVRAGLAELLLDARRALPARVGLLIVEGYRPLALQRGYFDQYCAELRADHPEWTDARVRREASAFICPPELAPHVSGAAIDLTLCTDAGVELPMGTAVNADPARCERATYMAATNIAAEHKENRGILVDALEPAGLVNYPTEWWHWSFGDRYWAYAADADAAIYGPVDLDAAITSSRRRATT